MPNNSNNDEFPTIRLDDEDRRDYQTKRQASPGSTSSPSPVSSTSTSSGGNGIWVVLIALIALSACGGCYYLFTLLEKQKVIAERAEERIMLLENKLSATGEEMGESTVALQVKVNELNDKTSELWEQMDKLWASAWRRNQKEIADLGERVSKVQSTANKDINAVSEDVDAQSATIGSLKNQLASVADELLAVNVRLEQTADDKAGTQQDVKNLADTLSVLEKRNASLSGKLNSLENEIREIATKLVSGTGANNTNGASPAGTSPAASPNAD
ncbi:hypothetical protein ACOJR9_11115 [Alteromonas sp. A081]|uniref:hypothetical protein n=1 Tax=Alteromonas sp. A081 TaxID=3410269 RepID=UPI003B983C9A